MIICTSRLGHRSASVSTICTVPDGRIKCLAGSAQDEAAVPGTDRHFARTALRLMTGGAGDAREMRGECGSCAVRLRFVWLISCVCLTVGRPFSAFSVCSLLQR